MVCDVLGYSMLEKHHGRMSGPNIYFPRRAKTSRPNLGIFWANCVFATAKRDFLLYFDRTIADFSVTPSFAASVQFCQAASCTC